MIKIEGEKELQKAFEALEKRTRNRYAKAGVEQAIPIVVNNVRANAQRMVGGQMGMLLAGAYVPHKMRRMNDAVGLKGWFDPAYNGLFIHETKAGNRYFIPNAIEYGHVIATKDMGNIKFASNKMGALARRLERKGADRVPAIPFVRNGAEQARYPATEKVMRVVAEKIEKAWKSGGQT